MSDQTCYICKKESSLICLNCHEYKMKNIILDCDDILSEYKGEIRKLRKREITQKNNIIEDNMTQRSSGYEIKL